MRAFSDRFIALVCALGVLAVLMTGARAGPYEDGLLRFTADSFDETIEGINTVATSGNALAAQVIGALQEGRLLFSANEKRAQVLQLVLVEFAPCKFESSSLNRAQHNLLKLCSSFPWADFFRIDIKQLQERFVIVLRQIVAEETCGP